MRRVPVVLAALVAIVSLGVLVSPAAAAAPVRVELKTSTAKAIVNKPWRWTVTARTRSGKALRAKMRLQILFGPTVVGCWKKTTIVQCFNPREGTWISFRGKRTGTLEWPAESIGPKLTFQAIVVVGKRTYRLRAPVSVRSA